MKFSREETISEVLRLHGEGKTLADICDQLNKAGHTNSWGNELSQQNLSAWLKAAEEKEATHRRKVVSLPAAPADKEGEKAMKGPKNPTEGKAILVQQILQTKDIELSKRFTMAAEVLLS